MRIGFHASHEQISPTQLLSDVQHAERAGFEMAMCSDHFAPWSARQAHSGYTWSWLGAALATTKLSIGCVSSPGNRYHPAILAQKIATLAQMFEGRFWTGLASGQLMNEHVTGQGWPTKEERGARLDTYADIIRRLLQGEEVTSDDPVRVDRAYLWDRPEQMPALIGPAISAQSAGRIAAWADGLITLNQPLGVLRDVLDSYGGAGGTGPRSLQLHLSWAPTLAEAEAIAKDQWATNVFDGEAPMDLDMPASFDALAEHVTMDSVHESVRISDSTEQFVDWIGEYAEMGFDDIYLHHVGQRQQEFLDLFGEKVLPQLR